MQAGSGGVPFLQLLVVIVKVELHVALHDLLAPSQEEPSEQLQAHPLQGGPCLVARVCSRSPSCCVTIAGPQHRLEHCRRQYHGLLKTGRGCGANKVWQARSCPVWISSADYLSLCMSGQ